MRVEDTLCVLLYDEVVKLSPGGRRARKPTAREPLFLWWMPLAGLALAAGWGIWEASRDAHEDTGERSLAFVTGLAWPGLAIFAVTTFLVWLAWKVDLE